MKGQIDFGRPSLALMTKDVYATEFVVMITAVEAWSRRLPGQNGG
jgi:hypothetical protein